MCANITIALCILRHVSSFYPNSGKTIPVFGTMFRIDQKQLTENRFQSRMDSNVRVHNSAVVRLGLFPYFAEARDHTGGTAQSRQQAREGSSTDELES
ncbi:MAG: hypothetical protein NC489_36520 [Ruminococcus flavefaciens]|nr:hypothetical protein [Ruminococcus flavefaciens]